MNDKIKVLLVDDDFEFLYLIEDKLEDDEQIEVKIFEEIIDDNVGKSFIHYLKNNKDNFIADVIFCDYDLKNSVLASHILKEANKISSIPPIVVMTANENSLQKEAIESINIGARDYIIKSSSYVPNNNDYFLQELHIGAMRIYLEEQQRNIHKIISSMPKDIEDIDTLAQNFVNGVIKYYPYYTIVVREYKGSKLHLRGSNITNKDLMEEIKELDRDNAKFLFELLNGDDDIILNNDFRNEKLNFSPKAQDGVDSLKLETGLLIRIGSKNNPLGTISIYATNMMFNHSQKESFGLISQSIQRDWQILDEKIRKEEALAFIDNSVKQDKESKIWDDLCKLMHRQFNQNSNQTKTTIKVASVGSNILKRDYCEGISCSTERDIEIDNHSVSSWVYRNNHFVCIGTDSFKDIEAIPKKLNTKFIDSICIHNRDKKIEYIETHPSMKSGICIPISVDDQVLGVLNLEAPSTNIYCHRNSKNIRKEIESLIKIPARRILNIRQQKFMKSMIKTISKEKYEDRFKEAKAFLKDFIGYDVFIVAVKNKGKLELEEFDFREDKDLNQSLEMKAKIGKCINSQSAIKDFVENNKKEFLYIDDMDEYKKTNTVAEGDNGKAQYLVKLTSKNRTNGVISFQFKVKNPLNENTMNLLKGFIKWLNRDINENIENKALRNRERYFKEKNNMDWYFRNLSHIIGGAVGNIGANLETMEYLLDNKEALFQNIKNSQKYLQSISNFPKRFISSVDYSFNTIDGAYNAIMNDLSLRVEDKIIRLSLERINISTSNTANIYMVLFHPILNALEEKSISEIDIIGKIEDKTYILNIEDNGDGFNNLETLFTRNITTKSSGSGFGLYHIKQIIENELDGIIEVMNNNGGVITIMLPIKYQGDNYEI